MGLKPLIAAVVVALLFTLLAVAADDEDRAGVSGLYMLAGYAILAVPFVVGVTIIFW